MYGPLFLFVKALEDITMPGKSTYEELAGRIKELEQQASERRYSEEELKKSKAMFKAVVDISPLKRTEALLRESEARYRSLAENSMVGCWEITLEGYTTYINPAMCSMIEIEGPEALSGETYHSFFTRKSLETIDHERIGRFEGKGSCYEVEIVGKRGGRRYVVICGASLLSGEDKLQGYIATFTDITDRKKTEEELRKAHDRLEYRVKERTGELEIKTKSLEEINTAMTVLLKKREDDRKEL
jgi:PAS domain S-box-containing protein